MSYSSSNAEKDTDWRETCEWNFFGKSVVEIICKYMKQTILERNCKLKEYSLQKHENNHTVVKKINLVW